MIVFKSTSAAFNKMHWGFNRTHELARNGKNLLLHVDAMVCVANKLNLRIAYSLQSLRQIKTRQLGKPKERSCASSSCDTKYDRPKCAPSGKTCLWYGKQWHFAVKYLEKRFALMPPTNKVGETSVSREYAACLDVNQKPNVRILTLTLAKLKS